MNALHIDFIVSSRILDWAYSSPDEPWNKTATMATANEPFSGHFSRAIGQAVVELPSQLAGIRNRIQGEQKRNEGLCQAEVADRISKYLDIYGPRIDEGIEKIEASLSCRSATPETLDGLHRDLRWFELSTRFF
jgi:hypothetical protein